MERWSLLCQRPPPWPLKFPRHSRMPLPSVSNIFCIVVYAFFLQDSEDDFPSTLKRKHVTPLPTPIKSGPTKGKGKRVERRQSPLPPSDSDSKLDFPPLLLVSYISHSVKFLIVASNNQDHDVKATTDTHSTSS